MGRYRTLKEHRKILGTCRECDDDPVPKRKRCQKHLERARKRDSKRRTSEVPECTVTEAPRLSPLAVPPAIDVRNYWANRDYNQLPLTGTPK